MYRFKVCELKTGDVLNEAPFRVSGDLTRTLQGYGMGTLELLTRHDSCPANWEHLILPKRNLLLVVDEQDRIVWHGIPTKRRRKGDGVVAYPCVTVEGYLLCRYVPTRVYVQRDQALIAEDLLRVAADSAGLPLRTDCPLTGVLRDREYADDENARIYDRLQELAAVENGFNWTIDVDWTDDSHTRVAYTFRTGYPHLGHRTPTPEHVFNLPGNVTGYEHEDQWGETDAATHTQAVGDGDGETKTISAPVIDTRREAAGWPRIEVRRQFSGVKVQRTIDGHAQAMAAQLFGGQEVITLDVRNDAGTSLGSLTLGDSARVSIADKDLTLQAVFVVVGWAVTPDSSSYKPTLARIGDAEW